MKSIKFILKSFLLVIAMMSIISCSDEENAIMQDGSNLLKINTSIADTRNVITGTAFQNDDQIGIYVKSADGHEYTGNSSNIKATHNEAGWQLESDVELKSDAATVYAYYPYNANASGVGDSIDINIAPAANIGQTDYMYGSCSDINLSNTTANIKFNHALARITLAITKGNNDIGNGILSKVKIENDTLYEVLNTTAGLLTKKIGKGSYISTKGKMDLKTGGIRRIVDQNATVEVSTNYTINKHEVEYIELLIEPCGEAMTIRPNNQRGGEVCAILTIDGNTYKVSLGYPYWEGGKQYTYPITVNRATKPEIKFNGHAGVDMGILTETGNPLYWGTCNIGADAIESYGELYCWGDPTGEKTSEQYSSEYNGEYDFFPEDISGTEFDIAHVKWGSKWRIPTKMEWKQLLESSTLEFVTLGNIKGTRVTSTINGNSIFLPAAGYYNHNPSIGNGTWELTSYESLGAYWSSTRSWQHAYVSVVNDIKDGWNAPLAGWYSVRPVLGD